VFSHGFLNKKSASWRCANLDLWKVLDTQLRTCESPEHFAKLDATPLGFPAADFLFGKIRGLIFKLVHLTSLTLQTEKLRWHCFDVFLHGEISALLAKYELFWKDAKTPGNAWDGGVAISVFVAPNSSCCNPLTWKMINSVMQKYQGDKKTHYRWWFQIFFASTNICQMGWNHC